MCLQIRTYDSAYIIKCQYLRNNLFSFKRFINNFLCFIFYNILFLIIPRASRSTIINFRVILVSPSQLQWNFYCFSYHLFLWFVLLLLTSTLQINHFRDLTLSKHAFFSSYQISGYSPFLIPE